MDDSKGVFRYYGRLVIIRQQVSKCAGNIIERITLDCCVVISYRIQINRPDLVCVDRTFERDRNILVSVEI